MPPLPSRTRPSPPTWRRAAAAALLALQAVVALLPAAERRGVVRMDTHMEVPGNPHLPAHDEATCAVCAARALSEAVPEESGSLFQPETIGRADLALKAVVPTVGAVRDYHSRAPPLVD